MSTAAERAQRLYPESAKHFRAAYVDGAASGVIGAARTDCPYRNTRRWAAWRTAWLRGFDSVQGIDNGAPMV